MSSEAYKIFTKTYFEKRNAGLLNHSDVTDYEYEYYDLEWPDGYTQETIKRAARILNLIKVVSQILIGSHSSIGRGLERL